MQSTVATAADFQENCKLGKTQVDKTLRLLITKTILLMQYFKIGMCSCVCVCVCVPECVCVFPGDHKRVSDPPMENYRQPVDLLTKSPSCERAVNL